MSSPDKSDRKRGENQELSEADNLKWIQQLADWTSETPDSDEFLGSLKEDLGAAEVYVFTPKGKIVSLPAEATPIDFAYCGAHRSRSPYHGCARERDDWCRLIPSSRMAIPLKY